MSARSTSASAYRPRLSRLRNDRVDVLRCASAETLRLDRTENRAPPVRGHPARLRERDRRRPRSRARPPAAPARAAAGEELARLRRADLDPVAGRDFLAPDPQRQVGGGRHFMDVGVGVGLDGRLLRSDPGELVADRASRAEGGSCPSRTLARTPGRRRAGPPASAFAQAVDARRSGRSRRRGRRRPGPRPGARSRRGEPPSVSSIRRSRFPSASTNRSARRFRSSTARRIGSLSQTESGKKFSSTV